MSATEIRVEIPGRPYTVAVGAGILADLAQWVPLDGAETAILIADETVAGHYGGAVEKAIAAAGPRVLTLTVAGGETAKTMATAARLLGEMAAAAVHRSDLVVTLGGGVTGDLAGFVAAMYARGIAYAHVPTTVLAQVDASIGGKTGVNLPEGKNLAGAFHQPSAVVADTATLATLPVAELRSGLAEVVKHGLIADAGILTLLEEEREAVEARDAETLSRLIAQAIAVKAEIVAEDEREHGRRAFLNYGHTLGHALEAHGGYRSLRHGEAVAIGMMFAAHLARILGFADRVAEHRAAIEAAGLPTGGADARFDDLLPWLARDKKADRGVRFVVLEDLGRPRLERPDERALRAAYEEVR